MRNGRSFGVALVLAVAGLGVAPEKAAAQGFGRQYMLMYFDQLVVPDISGYCNDAEISEGRRVFGLSGDLMDGMNVLQEMVTAGQRLEQSLSPSCMMRFNQVSQQMQQANPPQSSTICRGGVCCDTTGCY